MDKDEANRRLRHATLTGNTVDAQAALDAGADVMDRNEYKGTPLHDAAWRGHADIARMLIEKGADVNAQNEELFTPLHLAARGGHTDTASVLITNGADVNAQTDRQFTPRYFAMNGHPDIVKLLENADTHQQRHANRVTGELVEGMLITPPKQGHAGRVTEERKDKGPPKIGG